MVSFKVLLPAFLVLAALVLATLMLAVINPSQSGPTGDDIAAQPTKARVETQQAFREPDSGIGFGSGDEAEVRPVIGASAGSSSAGAESALQVTEASWEAPINAILESAEDNNAVARRLDALAPTLPLEGQVEATQHMVNLLDDQNYQAALQKLTNLSTPPAVMEVIYSDILNRPNSVKLPALVNVFAAPGHPLRTEALDTLQIFVGRDLGNDPQAWNVAVQDFLRIEAQQENADFAEQ
jgi:hypothetical protein